MSNSRNSKTKREIKAKLMKGRQRARCSYCSELFSAAELTLDHIIPLSRGGTWQMNNLQVMCEPCNQAKGNKMWGE